jgi:hypothetical protein
VLLTQQQVEIAELAPSSVTEYVWRIGKFGMKPAGRGVNASVNFAANATLRSELEVRVRGCEGV